MRTPIAIIHYGVNKYDLLGYDTTGHQFGLDLDGWFFPDLIWAYLCGNYQLAIQQRLHDPGQPRSYDWKLMLALSSTAGLDMV